MDFIPGGADSRFVFIHIVLFGVVYGTLCTYHVLRKKCKSISRLRTYLILATAYVAIGVLYLMFLHSSQYQALCDYCPWVADVVEIPVRIFCVVDRILAPHAGGTALHALQRSYLLNKT